MRQTAITAMLFAAAMASRQTKSQLALKARLEKFAKHAHTLQADLPPLPPDRHCYTWEDMTEDCEEQWFEWDWFCEDNWTPMCERVAEEWFSSDIDFLMPDRPDESCAIPPHEWDETCQEQWDTLWAQCWYETDKPYWWSSECDAIESFEEAWGIWYDGFDDEDFAANLKRAYEKKQPRIKVMRAAYAKHLQTSKKAAH